MGDDSAEDVIEVMVPLIVIFVIGYLIGRLKVFHKNYMVTISQLNRVVFSLGIPALVFKGLATKDFFHLDWDFVLIFLITRAAFGMFAFTIAAGASIWGGPCRWIWGHKNIDSWFKCSLEKDDFLGTALTSWIGMTWMNTIIFGIPLLQALYGPKISILNILAAISSLFFQLPAMLFFFEVRAIWRRHTCPSASEEKMWGGLHENKVNSSNKPSKDVEAAFVRLHTSSSSTASTVNTSSGDSATPGWIPMDHCKKAETCNKQGKKKSAQKDKLGQGEESEQYLCGCEQWCRQRWDKLKKMVQQTIKKLRRLYKESVPWPVQRFLGFMKNLATNPPIIGVLLGLLYSLTITSTRDPEFPLYLDYFCTWLGNAVTPLAALCVGLFVNSEFFRFPKSWKALRIWVRVFFFLVVKHLVLPLFVIVVLLQLGIEGVKARAAVIIAALPVALASFSLGKMYGVGLEEHTLNIVLGTALMAPVSYFWTVVLDEWDLWDDDNSAFKGGPGAG